MARRHDNGDDELEYDDDGDDGFGDGDAAADDGDNAFDDVDGLPTKISYDKTPPFVSNNEIIVHHIYIIYI